MAQTRLLEVRHGGSTTVRDFRRYAGLDLLPALLVRGGSRRRRASPAASSRRASLIGPGVAGARRRAPATDALVGRSAAPSTRSRPPTTTSSGSAHALAYWDLVVDAADSITFRLMFNSLRVAYEPALEALAPGAGRGGRASAGAYRVLTAALGEGDPRHRPRRRRARAAPEHRRSLLDRPGDAVEEPMTADPDIEAWRPARLAADEARITGSRRRAASPSARRLAGLLAPPVARG